MKKWLSLLLLAFLAGCGPREIGRGAAEEAGTEAGAPVAEQMRHPMTGATNTQRLLYYSNRPDLMEAVQKWRAGELRRRMGIQPEDPAYRETPKQRSPFRQ